METAGIKLFPIHDSLRIRPALNTEIQHVFDANSTGIKDVRNGHAICGGWYEAFEVDPAFVRYL